MESLCKMDFYRTEVAKQGRITVSLFPGPPD